MIRHEFPVFPPKLERGMTVGVIATSSAIRDERLAAGIALIEERGYTVKRGRHLYDRHGYLAGTDEARARDLTEMFADPEVHAVVCARGGYGAWRMLEMIDWEVVRANPKVFVGYSDVTTLHLAMERRADLPTLYGPMVVSHGGGLSEASSDCFWRAIERNEPLGLLPTSGDGIQTLVSGRATGRLAGGCLALLASSAGTAEQPDFCDRIVLIEDVDEAVYHVDRHVSQLLRSGALHQAAGFVIGTVTNWNKADAEPPIGLERVWRDLIVPLGKPTVTGFPFGHEPNPLTLPLGCTAEMDADASTLTVLEAAVR